MICKPRSFGWSLMFGLLVAGAGVVLLLDQQGLLDAGRVFQYFWPAVCIAFGLIYLFQGGGRRMWGGVLLVIGVLLALDYSGRVRVPIWPLIIIAVGGMMIWQAIAPNTNPLTGKVSSWRDQISRWGGGNSTDSDFNQVAILGGFKRRFTGKNFRGGNILTICGGFDIDLRQASIEGDGAVIDATSVMGGGEIKVPSSWVVSIEGMGIMGAFVDETNQIPATDSAPRQHLVVKGIAFMGGVVVKN
jgi:Cell wall-active antibiotics response 4TMS YvqF/Domain of unknown function (DUF5668)